ncbi:hypothetical protein BDV93DRAFT_505423 [Ceratobasidium sp. AG-I]|nr:hypothetical protein BDV93DRAFT_505423 [Ceratobasidium sp. AG-I]
MGKRDSVGWNRLLALIPYGDGARRIRKLLHDGMNPKIMQDWWPLQEQEALKFLQRLLHAPGDLMAHIRQYASSPNCGASVVKLTYGYTVKDKSDEYISFSVATAPGMFMADVLPSRMRIPANAAGISNVWSMLRIVDVYKDSSSFNPSRFTGRSEEPNPENVVFGFGRRRRPGIAVVQSSVWLSISLTLAAYDIIPMMGEDGRPKLPSVKYSNTTVSHPNPFECSIAVKSEKIQNLIETVLTRD